MASRQSERKNLTVCLLFTMKAVINEIAKISATSPIVINMPTTELLAGETMSPFA